MRYLKIIGFGVLLWVIMFAVVSAVLPWYSRFEWMKLIVALISGSVSFSIAAYAGVPDMKTGLLYGVMWLAVAIALEALITMRFNPDIFKIWSLWLGYFLGVLAPIIRGRLASKPESVPIN